MRAGPSGGLPRRGDVQPRPPVAGESGLDRGLRDLALPLSLLIANKVTEENRTTAERVASALKRQAGRDVPVATVALNRAFGLGGDTPLYDIAEDLTAYFKSGGNLHV